MLPGPIEIIKSINRSNNKTSYTFTSATNLPKISQRPSISISMKYFFVKNKDLVYEGFYEDFGPLNLSKIWKYTTEVSKIISDSSHKDHIFYHQTSSDYRKHCNAALLMCAFQVLSSYTKDDYFE